MIYIILLLALGLRLIMLNQSFWLDEAISAITSSKPFPYQWFGITGDFQPPLFYIFLHFYMQLGIKSEWFLRLPSILFGVLTIYFLFLLAKELFNTKIAIIASLLLATSQFHIYYSQELRMYSLLALLATLSMWFFYKNKWKWLIAINILGLYTNYLFGSIFIPQVIWLWKEYHRKRNIWVTWFMTVFIPFLFFLPWIPIFWQQWQTSQSLLVVLPQWKNILSLPIWTLLPQIFLKFTLGRIDFDNKYLYGLIFLAVLTLYGYIFSNLKTKIDKKMLFIINWLIIPLIGICILSLFVPIAGVWRLIFLLPPFLLLVSIAIEKTKYPILFISIILSINLGANLLYWTQSRYQRENWKEAVMYLDSDEYPIVFTVGNGFEPYQWYKTKNKLICGKENISQCLSYNNIYYVTYLQDLFDPTHHVESQIMNKGYKTQEIKDYPGVGFIKKYARSASSGHDE